LGEEMLTGAVFLDVAKTFIIMWVDDFLYKFTVRNILSYLVKIIFPTCMLGCSKRPSNQPHALVVACGMAWITVE